MATARIERKIDRHILNLADATDVRDITRGTCGFRHLLTSSMFGAMSIKPMSPHGYCPHGYWLMHGRGYGLPFQPMSTGNHMPGLGARARAERRASRQRYQVV